MSNWHPKSCSDCSLYGIGKGFAVGCGDPAKAKIAVVLESPYLEEVNFGVWPPAGAKRRYVLGDVRESQAEMRRRTAAYPNIEPRLLSRGVPVVGRTGYLFNQMLEAAGIARDAIFIDNSIRCIPPRGKTGQNWPTGNDKHIAVSACRQYDRLDEFKPTVVVFSIHPSAVLRETTPYLLIVEDLRKVKEFADQGERVLLLMGGNAVDTYFGFFKNVTRSRGHYEFVGEEWLTNRANTLMLRAEKARRGKMPKSERPRKKTKGEVAREELAAKIVDLIVCELRNEPLCERDHIVLAEKHLYFISLVTAALAPPPRTKKPKTDVAIPGIPAPSSREVVPE